MANQDARFVNAEQANVDKQTGDEAAASAAGGRVTSKRESDNVISHANTSRGRVTVAAVAALASCGLFALYAVQSVMTPDTADLQSPSDQIPSEQNNVAVTKQSPHGELDDIEEFAEITEDVTMQGLPDEDAWPPPRRQRRREHRQSSRRRQQQ